MPWELTGNAGTNPATNFLGTAEETVPQPLVIKTNGAERMRITADGNVGIGTTMPSASLSIRDGNFLNPQLYIELIQGEYIGNASIRLNRITKPTPEEPGGRLGRYWDIVVGAPRVGDEALSFHTRGSDRPDITIMSLNTERVIIFEDLLVGGSLDVTSGGNWEHPQLVINQIHQDGWARIRFTRTTPPVGRHWDIAVGGSVGLEVMNFNVQDTGDIMTLSRDGAEIKGTLTVSNDIVLTNADCAEEFDIEADTEIEPGTVMVLTSEGALQPSWQASDKRVLGVISGAGSYKPGIILDKQQSSDKRVPIALVGKVYCKVDAQYNPIEIGDLLTTSPTAGYAMKAVDPLKAFGSVIGKALRPLEVGQGLIPIVIALQ